ncbi:MAG: hypothetical protein AAFU79_22115 [Myxococcota bacterium]
MAEAPMAFAWKVSSNATENADHSIDESTSLLYGAEIVGGEASAQVALIRPFSD